MTKFRTPTELAEELIGTAAICVVPEMLETVEDVEAFDQLAFECDGCGWWCSTDELHNTTDDNLCDECTEESGED